MSSFLIVLRDDLSMIVLGGFVDFQTYGHFKFCPLVCRIHGHTWFFYVGKCFFLPLTSLGSMNPSPCFHWISPHLHPKKSWQSSGLPKEIPQDLQVSFVKQTPFQYAPWGPLQHVGNFWPKNGKGILLKYGGPMGCHHLCLLSWLWTCFGGPACLGCG